MYLYFVELDPVKFLGPVKLDHVELDHELLDPVEIDLV